MRGSATVRVLVLQPTSFCNIDCSYCYVPDRTISHRMKDDVLAGIAKLVDFCLVASAAALSFVLYHRSLGQDLPEWDRYGLSAVLGALLFVIGFLNAGGYELSRLKNLRWQLMRTTTIWATVASALLFLAFLWFRPQGLMGRS